MCAVYANILRGGTNSFQTGADDFSEFMYWTMSDGIPPIGTIAAGTPITGDFATQAQSTPNKTVKVKAGKILIKATPTSESERLFTVTLSADANVTITDNTSGSTKYDVIYVTLPADSLHDPALSGDLTEAACLGVERHTAAGVGLTVTNAIAIAEVTVANGFSSIANAVIADKRKYAQSYGPMDWNPIIGTISCGSTNVITVPAGALKRVSIGDKIWCKDDGVDFMGYVVAVTDTTVTVKGGTKAGVGADIASSSVITELFYSKVTSPVGFPANTATFSPIGANYAEVTSPQGSITIGSDLTNLTLTVTVPTGKRIRLRGVANFYSSAAGDELAFSIREDATVLQIAYRHLSGTQNCVAEVIITPTAGAHTYKLYAQRDSGTGNITMYAGATFPCFISAEII